MWDSLKSFWVKNNLILNLHQMNATCLCFWREYSLNDVLMTNALNDLWSKRKSLLCWFVWKFVKERVETCYWIQFSRNVVLTTNLFADLMKLFFQFTFSNKWIQLGQIIFIQALSKKFMVQGGNNDKGWNILRHE